MASVVVTLTDMGTYDVAGSFGSAGTEEQAYGSADTEGTALNINATEITLTMENSLNDAVALQKKASDTQTKRFVMGEVDHIGMIYPTWKIKGVFDISDTEQLKDYGRLRHMMKTKGYKRLGYSTSGTSIPAQIINYADWGELEFDSSGATIEFVNVKLKQCVFVQRVKGGTKIEYTLTCVETN